MRKMWKERMDIEMVESEGNDKVYEDGRKDKTWS